MSLSEVETFVRDRLGLDPAALGSTVLQRSMDNRMRANGLTTSESYLAFLKTRPDEIESLAAGLLVSETWFFRGGQSLFQKLSHFLLDRASEHRRGFPVRILSLPCSTGEEPYSLAIALHECGLPSHKYRIDAADLSRVHVEKAMAGLYSDFAFREPGPDIRPTYFRPSANCWSLLPQIRQTVHFHVGNVTDPAFLAGEKPYDLVLCRNLFIYLTDEARKRAIATLYRLLAPNGLLCVTPAEADRLPLGHFIAEGPLEFGLYRRAAPASSIVSPVTHPPRKKPKSTIALRHKNVSHSLPSQSSSLTTSPLVEAVSLDRARSLANSGCLVEARAACEELIRLDADLPDAHTLLGVIHQAEGRTSEAAEAFRKALYLNPNHVEALTHMAVLHKARGDASLAAALQRRLKRLAKEDQP